MGVIKDTLKENYIFFVREMARLDEAIKSLPPGSISIKKIGNSTYYYRQWREGKRVKSVSLGAQPPSDLVEKIKRRKSLEEQRKSVLGEISVIARAVDTLHITAGEIIKLFSENKINVMLIGSYCLPVIRENLEFNLPTIKTQDIDFLVEQPYKGKKTDIETLLKPLGFSIGFNPDGSTYFNNGLYKVEFLTPEKGKGSEKAVTIDALKIKVTPLRFLQMLFDQQMVIKEEGYSYRIPSPWVLACHKVLIAGRRQSRAKKDKDLLQANALFREILKNAELNDKLISYIKTLPPKWRKVIKEHIAKRFSEDLPPSFM
jgi:hypothetical protein